MNRIVACALALLLMAGCTQPAAGSSSQSPTPAAPPPASSATAPEASQSQSAPPVSQPVATAEESQPEPHVDSMYTFATLEECYDYIQTDDRLSAFGNTETARSAYICGTVPEGFLLKSIETPSYGSYYRFVYENAAQQQYSFIWQPVADAQKALADYAQGGYELEGRDYLHKGETTQLLFTANGQLFLADMPHAVWEERPAPPTVLTVPLGEKAVADAAFAEEILSHKRSPADSPQVVHPSNRNLGLVEDFLTAVKAKQPAELVGYAVSSPAPLLYQLSYTPGLPLALTEYRMIPKLLIEKSTVTDIYVTDAFYHFTDNRELYFAISRQAEPLDITHPDGVYNADIKGALLTTTDAIAVATDAFSKLNAYTQLKDNPWNGLGYFVPPADSAATTPDPEVKAVVESTARISGQDYYQVWFYENENTFAGAYYINANDPAVIYLVSMVDGSLLPLRFSYTEQIQP